MKRKLLIHLTALAVIGVGSASLNAQQSPNADNTKVNSRDRAGNAPTADQAKNNLSDRDLMQKIRKSVVDDKSLSTYAHNVKIIAQNGKVTLKGPVRSEEEKRSVEQKAADVAGSGNVANQLTIKASKAKTQ
ncbi:MAG: BON domain-containing protein [Acidobacteriia bacterium]|nr:BON domain-containing protein [Terriglobia bacterium]MBV8905192.1 BON domain-containing protein [Terriglobia bacterium]MBV9744404.1 BON domain-containing protein [Terriglobia bacterium]